MSADEILVTVLPVAFAFLGAWTLINTKVAKVEMRVKALEDNQLYARTTIDKIFDSVDKIKDDISEIKIELQKKQNIQQHE